MALTLSLAGRPHRLPPGIPPFSPFFKPDCTFSFLPSRPTTDCTTIIATIRRTYGPIDSLQQTPVDPSLSHPFPTLRTSFGLCSFPFCSPFDFRFHPFSLSAAGFFSQGQRLVSFISISPFGTVSRLPISTRREEPVAALRL